VEVWQTSNLRRLRLGEEKKTEERKKPRQNYNGLSYSIGDHKNEDYKHTNDNQA